MKLSEAVEIYIAMRDKKAEIDKARKAEVAVIQEKMDKLEGQLMVALDKLGGEGMRTAAGTAYISSRTSATIADKDAFMRHVKANQAFELLDVRANKTAVDAYATEFGDVPPGVNYRIERTVSIRRNNA
jgi:hypothetical protein